MAFIPYQVITKPIRIAIDKIYAKFCITKHENRNMLVSSQPFYLFPELI